MRTEKIEVLHGRGSTPLVVRARFEKTFLGLGLFLAVNLLLYGTYLLVQAIVAPLEANEMTVLGAGFTLTLACFAITYLLWPRSRSALARPEFSEGSPDLRATPEPVYGEPLPNQVRAKQVLAAAKHLPGPM